jgi:hypothetical protein
MVIVNKVILSYNVLWLIFLHDIACLSTGCHYGDFFVHCMFIVCLSAVALFWRLFKKIIFHFLKYALTSFSIS